MRSPQAATALPWVLGISASHNGAYCLLHGDEIVVAIQEERLTGAKRRRIYGAQPALALEYCLRRAGIAVDALSLVVTCMQGQHGDAEQDASLNPSLRTHLHGIPVLEIPHHLGHATSALAMSGWGESAILVVDGIGSGFDELGPAEQAACLRPFVDGRETTSLYMGRGTTIEPLEKHLVDHGAWLGREPRGMPAFGSLGGMFSAVAQLMFGDRMEAGKVMGLAPYGRATIPTEDFFRIEGERFVFERALATRFADLKPWPANQALLSDLAASVQRALEDALFHLTRKLRAKSGSDRLCYTGGVALNSVANERILREVGFREVFIPPAAEDSGPAIGAAYHGLWSLTRTNTRRALKHDDVGAAYSLDEIDSAIARVPCVRRVEATDVLTATVERLAAGGIAGWFHGRSELGPRALGQRSIVCDPRRPDGKEVLNQRVKHREGFRPFAPAILLEEVEHWFDLEGTTPESPYMLRVCRFRPERVAEVPAVVHCDGTGRVQTLTRENNGAFYELVRAFHARTGVPILLNTSFNIMGEPIVETPEDALWDLLFTDLDFCVLHDRLVERTPGYVGPLDLVPTLVADYCRIEIALTPSGLDLSVPTEGTIPFGVQTPWGPTLQDVSVSLLPVLEQMDGRRDGHALLRALADDGHPMEARELCSMLLRLRRRHLIGFRA